MDIGGMALCLTFGERLDDLIVVGSSEGGSEGGGISSASILQPRKRSAHCTKG